MHPGWIKPIETIGDQCWVIPLGNSGERERERERERESWMERRKMQKEREKGNLAISFLALRTILPEASTRINLRRMQPPRDREIKVGWDSAVACR